MLEPHSNFPRVPACRSLIRNPIPLLRLLPILVLVAFRECSAFVPTPAAPQRSSRHGVTGVRVLTGRAASTTRGTSSLPLASVASDGPFVISSSYAQKFLAEQEASGRVLTKRDQKWWARFEELEEYKREFGDCNVPYQYSANPQLGNWLFTQRQNCKKSKLDNERLEALESIGIEWVRPKGGQPDDSAWWKRLGELEEYKQEHGDCNVPINYRANMQLAKWVMNQRKYYHRFIDENWKQSPGITKERIKALNEIGFEWRLRERPEWDERYDELVGYKDQHGNTLVPMNFRSDSDNRYRELAVWVHCQRQQYRLLQEGKHSFLTDERIEKLNQIGFVWDVLEAAWEERFAELVSYKEMHGDTLVCGGSQLGNWVSVQRAQYRSLQEGKHSQLTDERIEKLSQIGFVWDAHEAVWEEKFSELVEFKATHGHTDVPSSWENNQLYNFAASQRKFYKKFKEGKATYITEERVKKLDSIGFQWASKQTYYWKQRLAELRDFYYENGVVPVPHTERSLYKWARKQKKEYDRFVRGESTSMDKDRIADLKSIGFFDAYGT